MGVLNVTPDSLSDGGKFVDLDAAVEHARRMARDGADIIDIGGESSRPGAAPVGVEEELRRVIPVIERIAAECPCLVSIDTTKAEVARRAVERGAHIVNDISAFTIDPDMSRVVADTGAGAVLMHMQGTPRTMQREPAYGDVVAEVTAPAEVAATFAPGDVTLVALGVNEQSWLWIGLGVLAATSLLALYAVWVWSRRSPRPILTAGLILAWLLPLNLIIVVANYAGLSMID